MPYLNVKLSKDEQKKTKGTSAGGRRPQQPRKGSKERVGGGRGAMAWSPKAKQWLPVAFLKETAKSIIREGVEYTKSEIYNYADVASKGILTEVRSALAKNRTDAGAQGGFKQPNGSITRTMTGGKLFKNPVLPLGTTVSSKISIGQNKLPKKSIAQANRFPVFNTQGSVILDSTTGATDFRKSTTGSVKLASINQNYYELIPLCLPNMFERRMALTNSMTYAGMTNANAQMISQAFDQPVTNENETATNDMIVNKYVPFNIYNKIKMQNIGKALPATVKMHIVQLKNQSNSNIGDYVEEGKLPFVATGIGTAMQAVMGKVKSSDQSNYTVLDGTDIGPGTDYLIGVNSLRWTFAEGTPSTNADIWGMENGLSHVSIVAATRKGRRLTGFSEFEEHFNIVKSSTFKIGAGNAIEVDIASHYNKCFNKIGNAIQLTDETENIIAGAVNNYTPEQFCLLLEVCGAPNQAFYEYQAGTTQGQVTRAWGVGQSSAVVNFSLETDYEFASKTNIGINGLSGEHGVEIFSRNYLDFPDTRKVGLDPIPRLSNLAEQEPDTWVSGQRLWIQPVQTPTITQGAGVKTLGQ